MKLPVCLLVFVCLVGNSVQGEEFSSQFEKMMETKTLTQIDSQLNQIANPSDDVKMAIGLTKFARALETLAQAQYRFGANNQRLQVPFMRFPVSHNPNPQPVTYQNLRELLISFQNELTTADNLLATINKSSSTLDVPILLFGIDENGDQKIEIHERLARIVFALNPRLARTLPGQSQDGDIALDSIKTLKIGFDQTDVYWLRGYCHLMLAMSDFILAHDYQHFFELFGYLFYSDPKDAWPVPKYDNNNMIDIIQLIAGIHELNFKVNEPKRYEDCRQHFKQVIALSRQCFEAAALETDNNHEWLPNPQQTGILDIRLSVEQIQTWHQFLDESENILEGKLLIPHPNLERFEPEAISKGINLKTLMTNPPSHFDPIMYLQGDLIKPYYVPGTCTSEETWDSFNDMFRGNFLGFAIWIN